SLERVSPLTTVWVRAAGGAVEELPPSTSLKSAFGSLLSGMVPPDGSRGGLRRGRRLTPRRISPLDVGHAFHLPDRLHNFAEMGQVVHLDENRAEHGTVL